MKLTPLQTAETLRVAAAVMRGPSAELLSLAADQLTQLSGSAGNPVDLAFVRLSLQRIQDDAAGRKWNSTSMDRIDMESWAHIEDTARAALARIGGTH